MHRDLYKSGVIRDIYFRRDRPGVAMFLECDSVEDASAAVADFPLAKAGLLTFECIPLGLIRGLGKSLFSRL